MALAQVSVHMHLTIPEKLLRDLIGHHMAVKAGTELQLQSITNEDAKAVLSDAVEFHDQVLQCLRAATARTS